MSKHERTMRIDSVDENGVFPMTLATEGEASDGDILSIAGGKIPERMPLLLSHWNDPTAKAGSVTNPVKDLKHSPPRLRSVGHIEMGGVGALADVRRDVAYMINRHGGAVSIRWDRVDGGKEPIRRVNLPSDHPYFVDADTEKSWRKRGGSFWPEWEGMEGSIVALGADKGAQVDGRIFAARAAETQGEVSAFWRSLAESVEAERVREAEHAEKPEPNVFEDAVQLFETTRKSFEGPEAEESDPEADAAAREDEDAKIAAAMAGLRFHLNDCREANACASETFNAVWESFTDEERGGIRIVFPEDEENETENLTAQLGEAHSRLHEMREQLEASEARATAAEAALEEERVRDDSAPSIAQERVDTGDPLQPLVTRPRELMSLLHEELRKAREHVNAQFRAEVEKARGRIEQ